MNKPNQTADTALEQMAGRFNKTLAHAQRLADALSLLVRTLNDSLRHPTSISQAECLNDCVKSSNKALAQWEGGAQ